MSAWRARGRPKGHEPYMTRRPTRLRGKDWLAKCIADRVSHYLVGWRDLDTGEHLMESFCPAERAYALHWWQMLRVLIFEGVVVSGDTHHPTTPEAKA